MSFIEYTNQKLINEIATIVVNNKLDVDQLLNEWEAINPKEILGNYTVDDKNNVKLSGPQNIGHLNRKASETRGALADKVINGLNDVKDKLSQTIDFMKDNWSVGDISEKLWKLLRNLRLYVDSAEDIKKHLVRYSSYGDYNQAAGWDAKAPKSKILADKAPFQTKQYIK